MKAMVVSKAFVNGMYRRKLDELVRLGVEVVAVSPPVWKEAGACQPLEKRGDERYDLRVLSMRFNGHFHVHYYPGLARLLSSVRPDVVHIDEEPYNVATFLGIAAARRERAASLFFTWQNLVRWYPPPFRDMERAVYRWSTMGIAGSEDARHVLEAKGYSGPIAIIPQFGVDPDLFAPGSKPNGPFTVGYFNRLIPGKAPILSLEAFSRLPADSRLRIVGDGSMRGEVEATVDALHLQSRVTVQPRVLSSRIPDLIRSLDVLILPSVTTPKWKEQFGRVLIEAMACGVPVIGSTSGEIPRVIGDAGILVPEGDVNALAAALQNVYDDADLRSQLSARGRQRVLNQFTHRRIAEKTLKAYREALAAH